MVRGRGWAGTPCLPSLPRWSQSAEAGSLEQDLGSWECLSAGGFLLGAPWSRGSRRTWRPGGSSLHLHLQSGLSSHRQGRDCPPPLPVPPSSFRRGAVGPGGIGGPGGVSLPGSQPVQRHGSVPLSALCPPALSFTAQKCASSRDPQPSSEPSGLVGL